MFQKSITFSSINLFQVHSFGRTHMSKKKSNLLFAALFSSICKRGMFSSQRQFPNRPNIIHTENMIISIWWLWRNFYAQILNFVVKSVPTCDQSLPGRRYRSANKVIMRRQMLHTIQYYFITRKVIAIRAVWESLFQYVGNETGIDSLRGREGDRFEQRGCMGIWI